MALQPAVLGFLPLQNPPFPSSTLKISMSFSTQSKSPIYESVPVLQLRGSERELHGNKKQSCGENKPTQQCGVFKSLKKLLKLKAVICLRTSFVLGEAAQFNSQLQT